MSSLAPVAVGQPTDRRRPKSLERHRKRRGTQPDNYGFQGRPGNAVPRFRALVNCAVPSRWISVQEAAVAAQKFTCPSVSAVAPACTVAVKGTTVPPATEDTAFPPEVRERVVVVAWDAQAGWGPLQARHAIASVQANKTSGAGRVRPATIARKRISPILQRKWIVLLLF